MLQNIDKASVRALVSHNATTAALIYVEFGTESMKLEPHSLSFQIGHPSNGDQERTGTWNSGNLDKLGPVDITVHGLNGQRVFTARLTAPQSCLQNKLCPSNRRLISSRASGNLAMNSDDRAWCSGRLWGFWASLGPWRQPFLRFFVCLAWSLGLKLFLGFFCSFTGICKEERMRYINRADRCW